MKANKKSKGFLKPQTWSNQSLSNKKGEKAQLKNLLVLVLLIFIIGFAVRAFNDTVDKSIKLNLEYENGSQFDTDNDGIGALEGIIDFTIENTNFTWDVNYTKLGTKWIIDSMDNTQTTTLCYGSPKTC